MTHLPGPPRLRPLADPAAVGAPAGPPPARALLGELRGTLELARLVAAAPWLARAPRGSGQVVIDLPGWKAPEPTGLPLRLYLRSLGYRTRSWGLGTNRGRPEADAEALAAQLAAEPAGSRVALVGWSLGGTIAREVARAVPDRVSCVVTFGSPVIGGPTHTLGARSYGPEEGARVDALIRELDADAPIEVPITALLTRGDAVVDWRACVDHASPRVEHLEVGSTHLSLGVDPDVWWAVADALHRHAAA